MIISLTSTVPTPEQASQIESFLAEFLPRMRRIDGVEGIHHYADADTGEHTTVVLWRDEAARREYMEGDLVKEAISFEQVTGSQASRRGFPVTIGLLYAGRGILAMLFHAASAGGDANADGNRSDWRAGRIGRVARRHRDLGTSQAVG